MPESNAVARTLDVYPLFAHEPYYPGPGTQEINTTLVAADILFHPRVLQPVGTRIHDLLTQLAVGDWERVTVDVVQLVQTQMCDALSLGLPEVARALICTGPESQVRAFAAGEFTVYGPDDRTKVLTEVGMFLTGLAAEQPLWPGDGLLPPLCQSA
ncbi:hypothetical protein ACWET9_43910 [Streptomyces sp. NPDC004059]